MERRHRCHVSTSCLEHEPRGLAAFSHSPCATQCLVPYSLCMSMLLVTEQASEPLNLTLLQKLQHELTLSTTMTSASILVLSLWATLIMVRS